MHHVHATANKDLFGRWAVHHVHATANKDLFGRWAVHHVHATANKDRSEPISCRLPGDLVHLMHVPATMPAACGLYVAVA
jgi:hypothetical protein